MMNKKFLGMAIVLAAVGVACGQGRVIFNVDVFSWLNGSVNDTVPYAAPPFASLDTTNAAQKITLVPGLGSSGIDTVKVSGTADVRNQTGGPGTLRLQMYLATDSAGTYGAGKDSLFTTGNTVNLTAGVNTQVLPLNVANLSPSGNALFNKSAIWIRIAARITNSSGAVMQGKIVLTSLNLRVVVQDNIF
jgi:hypothetical protein